MGLTDKFSGTNLYYSNNKTVPRNGLFGIHTPLFSAPEFNDRTKFNLITDKFDIYSLGMIIISLLTKDHSAWGLEHKKDIIFKEFIQSINFEKHISDQYNIEQVSYMLKSLIDLMIEKDVTYRYNIFTAMSAVVNIIYILDETSKKSIKDYLLKNYTSTKFYIKADYKSQIRNLDFSFLPKVYQLVAYNFKNRNIKDICKIHLERIIIKGTDLSDITIKYALCNFLDYSDKIPGNIFLDPGHSFIQTIIQNDMKFNRNKFVTIKNRFRNTRETIKISYPSIELDTLYNSIINKIKSSESVSDIKLINELKLVNLIADEVYKIYTYDQLIINRNLSIITERIITYLLSSEPSLSTREVDLHMIAGQRHGVCRHRAITFKYFCDKTGISCRLIRGLLYDSARKSLTNPINFNDGGYHAWNVIKLKNGSKHLFDIMNPTFSIGRRPDYSASDFKHLFAIPTLDIFIPLKDTYLKQKITNFNF